MTISMRRVVEGHIYDMETAELIGTVACCERAGYLVSQERTHSFCTRKNAFFLVGEGGACSRWREDAQDGNGWLQSEGLVPIREAKARPLVEKYVPNRTLAPVQQQHVLHRVQERLGFHLDGLCHQPTSATSRNGRKWQSGALG